jgi:hypothetical protein
MNDHRIHWPAARVVGLPLSLLILCSSPVSGASRLGGEATKNSGTWETQLKERVYVAIPADDAKGYRVLSEEAARAQAESPQSIERYRAAAPVRPTPERRTIVLQPLGEIGRAHV